MYLFVRSHKSALSLIDQFHNFIQLFLYSDIFFLSFRQFFIYFPLNFFAALRSHTLCLSQNLVCPLLGFRYQFLRFCLCFCVKFVCPDLSLVNKPSDAVIIINIFFVFLFNFHLQTIFLFIFQCDAFFQFFNLCISKLQLLLVFGLHCIGISLHFLDICNNFVLVKALH